MRRAFVALSAVAALIAACQLVAGIDDRSVAPDVADARFDAATIDSGPVDPCPHAYPPRPGASPDGPNVAPVLFALDLAIVTDRDGGRDEGFDLDGVCSTDSGATGSCVPCRGNEVDDPEGRDNAVGTVFQEIRKIFDAGAPTGPNRFRLLVEVDDYNGTNDDPNVTVSFFRSHGAEPVTEALSAAPKNDGSDVWSVTRDSLLPISVRAFVVDGRLVARVGDDKPGLAFDYGGAFLPGLAANRLELVIQDAVLVLPLQPAVTHGTLAGRWNAKALFTSLLPLPGRLGSDAGFLCSDPLGQAGLPFFVCRHLDLRTFARQDRTGSRCDAVSVVFSASAVKATRGTVFDLPELVDGCDASTVADCTSVLTSDQCDKP